jgi:hypothetical protein
MMSRYKELVEIFFSDDYRSRHPLANVAHKCIKCGRGLRKDFDPSDKLEYGIFALCPDCIKTPNITQTVNTAEVLSVAGSH